MTSDADHGKSEWYGDGAVTEGFWKAADANFEEKPDYCDPDWPCPHVDCTLP